MKEAKPQFSRFPLAVLVYVVNSKDEILLLSHPERRGAWEVINGMVEADETLLTAALRETADEAGPDLMVRPLGVFHGSTLQYGDEVGLVHTISYLMAYESGQVEPGDDMHGSRYGWFSRHVLDDPAVHLIVPYEQKWLLHQAVSLHGLWKDRDWDFDLDLLPDTRQHLR